MLTDAIELNNQGVALLQKGDDREAVAKLSKSLVLVQNLLSTLGSPSNCNSNTNTSSLGSSGPPHKRLRRSSSMSMSSSAFEEREHQEQPSFCVRSNAPLSSLDDQEFFVFNEAVELSRTNSEPSRDILPIYSACVIFNLALVYHRRAHSGGHSSSAKNANLCRQKASKMYSMIVRLLHGWQCQSQINRDLRSHTSCVLLQVAALNNLSHLQRHQDTTASSSPTSSLHTLGRLLQRYSNNVATSIFTKEERNAMLLNVITVTALAGTINLAAAAA